MREKWKSYGPRVLFFGGTFLLRMLLQCGMGIWFAATQAADDLLMILYAYFRTHFQSPGSYSLVKYMGFPVFLKLVGVSHIPYTIWLAVLWFAAALLAYFLMKRMGSGKWQPIAVYLYFLFLPQAFEYWCGTRLYRNAVLAPLCLILLLGMCLIFVRGRREEEKGNLIGSIILAPAFALTYFMKEDGAWLLACLLLWTALGLLRTIALNRREKRGGRNPIRSLVTYLLPIVILCVASYGYRTVNEYFYGVFETNTRTGGQPGHFCELVYRIDSPYRTGDVWAPHDAIEAAFAASETLSQYPGLLEAIRVNNTWRQDGEIVGDYLGWTLRTALVSSDMWTGEADVTELFRQANREIEAAFRDGTLPEVKGRVKLLASAGSRTVDEIFDLAPIIGESYAGAIFLKGYIPGISDNAVREATDQEEFVENARALTNVKNLDTEAAYGAPYRISVAVANVLIWIYRILNPALLLYTIAALVWSLVRGVRSLRSGKGVARNLPADDTAATRSRMAPNAWKTLALLLFLGIGFLYAFAIAWFSSFLFTEGINMTVVNFYNLALPGLLGLSYLFALSLKKS